MRVFLGNKIKKLGFASRKFFLIAALAIVATSTPTFAGNPGGSFCGGVITNSVGTSFSGIMLISIMIMLMMTGVIGLTYLFGNALRIDRLVTFAKVEFGEILITGIIVLITLGTFHATTTLFSFSSGQFNSDIFTSDCNNLYFTFLNSVAGVKSMLLTNLILSFAAGTTVEMEVDYFGLEQSKPFAGIGMLSLGTVGTILNIVGLITGVNLAVVAVLGIIYGLFPIFLFLGILFRTFPWTRAAGGTFIGLFAGFYIMFPVLLYGLIPQQTTIAPFATAIPYLTAPNAANLGTSYSNILSALARSIPIPNWNLLLLNISLAVNQTIAPSIYVIFGVVIAFIISFDFMEAVGDLLGAPSFSSRNTLRNII